MTNRVAELLNDDSISQIRQEINAFTEVSLKDYLQYLETIKSQPEEIPFGPKDIHDAVWGTISLKNN